MVPYFSIFAHKDTARNNGTLVHLVILFDHGIIVAKCMHECVLPSMQRLAGATLLVFANKQDLPGAMSKEAIQEVIY